MRPLAACQSRTVDDAANENIGIALMIRREGDMLVLEGAVTFDTVPELNSAAEENFRPGAGAGGFAAGAGGGAAWGGAVVKEGVRQPGRATVPLRPVTLPASMQKHAKLYGVSELLQPAN